MRCGKCGYLNNSTDSFCASCGERLSKQQSGEQFYNNENMQNYSGMQNNSNTQYNSNPQYNQQYNSNQHSNSGSGKATASLVCGIISLFCAGLILGIIAISFGIQARHELSQKGQPTGKATAGLVLGIIGVVGWAIIMIYYIAVGFDFLYY